jgi:hypothetical protein
VRKWRLDARRRFAEAARSLQSIAADYYDDFTILNDYSSEPLFAGLQQSNDNQ